MTYNINLDGESTGPAGPYLVWQYNMGQLQIDHCDTLQEALESARMWDDSDYGSFDCIEGPAGVVSDQAVQEWITAKHQAARAANDAAAAADQGKARFTVEVRHPGGKKASEWDSTPTVEEAWESITEAGFSLDRVRIKAVTWRRNPQGFYNLADEHVVKDWSDPAERP